MGKECRHPLTQSVLEFFGGRKMTIGQLEEERLDLGFSIKRRNQKPGGELGIRQRLLNTKNDHVDNLDIDIYFD